MRSVTRLALIAALLTVWPVAGAGPQPTIVDPLVFEMADTTGEGIATNRAGLPILEEANSNATLLLDYVVARGSYVDHIGRRYTQVVSVVPAAKLRKGNCKASPPMDSKRITEKDLERGGEFPAAAMLNTADISFRVKDTLGDLSDPVRFFVAFAADLYRGPFVPTAPDAPTDPDGPPR